MKKLITFLFLIVPLIILSQGQPVSSTIGLTGKIGNQEPANPDRSIPPGTLVWSQPPNCAGNIYASQFAANWPFDVRVADDFLFSSAPGQITAVRWWAGYWNPGYGQPVSWNIFIYNDINCLPDGLVTQWNIPFASSNEDPDCPNSPWSVHQYWATLTPAFNPVPGQHYWIVIQGVMNFQPQVGWLESTASNLCPAMQWGPYFYGDDLWHVLPVNMAFELYATPATPLSNWALILGVVLIGTFVFIRYRRMV
jgi:hypothetical protein